MAKASDLFIQCLEDEGVEYIFGVPGEENLDFLDSLSRSTRGPVEVACHSLSDVKVFEAAARSRCDRCSATFR
jgi:hypothetical protein